MLRDVNTLGYHKVRANVKENVCCGEVCERK